MTILALDLATKVGWAVAPAPYQLAPTALEIASGMEPPKRISGTKPFGSLSGQYHMMMAGFHRWLDDMAMVHTPDLIVYEAPLPHQSNPKVARIALGMAAITEMTAGERQIRIFELHNARLKKYATGNGGVKKEAMMRAARDRGWKFGDDNECDALWLADYGCHCMLASVR